MAMLSTTASSKSDISDNKAEFMSEDITSQNLAKLVILLIQYLACSLDFSDFLNT